MSRLYFLISCALVSAQKHQLKNDNSVQALSELSLDKLLRLKSSLQDFASSDGNTTVASFYEGPMGAQALPLHGSSNKRVDYESSYIKKTDYGNSKINSIFSLSVTTLAFLAFGGYLLCLIVQAVKYKSSMDASTTQPTFLVSAGIKKRPQSQLTASYGRKKRESNVARHYLGGQFEGDAAGKDFQGNMEGESFEGGTELGPSPDELFSALLGLCEGYAKWERLN